MSTQTITLPTPAACAGRPIAAKHIDHGFYRLTGSQARSLCVDGELPRHGHQKRAIPVAQLRDRLILQYWRSNRPLDGGRWEARDAARPIPDGAQCWISRTAITWHDGSPVAGGWTWAIHVWEP